MNSCEAQDSPVDRFLQELSKTTDKHSISFDASVMGIKERCRDISSRDSTSIILRKE